MLLSIVIPAHNEEKRILRTLNDYYKFFKSQGISFEIIVEMDGCIDKTEELVKEFSKGKKEIRYLVFKERLGKGKGILEGIKVCKGDYIGFVDADNSIKANEFYKLFLLCKNRGVHGVIASRNMGGYFSKRGKKHRAFFSLAFNVLVRVLFGLSYRDTQCGGKVFKREAIFKVLPEVKRFKESSGFLFDLVLLYMMKKKGFVIIECDVEWIDRKGSKVNPIKVALEMFLQAFRFRIRLWLCF